MKFKKLLLFLLLPLLVMSCRSMVNPNEWVVSTGTCWNSMTVTKAGSYVPRLYTQCDRMIILPATYLSADFMCETKFKNRVAGKLAITYQWRITDPKTFITNAKSITSSPTDEKHKVDPNALEAIENGVVDKFLTDLIREHTPSLPAGTDELSIEKQLAALITPRTVERGIEITNMSVNVNFTPQIEEALDVISAMEFYKANGIEDLGKAIIVEKAGAAHISSGEVKKE